METVCVCVCVDEQESCYNNIVWRLRRADSAPPSSVEQSVHCVRRAATVIMAITPSAEPTGRLVYGQSWRGGQKRERQGSRREGVEVMHHCRVWSMCLELRIILRLLYNKIVWLILLITHKLKSLECRSCGSWGPAAVFQIMKGKCWWKNIMCSNGTSQDTRGLLPWVLPWRWMAANISPVMKCTLFTLSCKWKDSEEGRTCQTPLMGVGVGGYLLTVIIIIIMTHIRTDTECEY